MNKIAIIEDDIDICNMIAKFLENNKYIGKCFSCFHIHSVSSIL